MPTPSMSTSSGADETWDAVVIGLGGVGSFALRSLVRRHEPAGEGTGTSGAESGGRSTLRALGLERFRVGHAKGSSHGGTRIFRHAYFEHPDYVPLLRYSTGEFARLEESAGSTILERCGNLIVERRRPAAVPSSDRDRDGGNSTRTGTGKVGHGDEETAMHTPLIDACLRSSREHSVPVELIDNDDLARRFPQFNFGPDHVGLYEPGGGFVRPEEAVTAAVEDAKRNGAEIREGVQVISILEREIRSRRNSEGAGGSGESVVVVRFCSEGGKEEEVLARKVIVAGGPWAGWLIPAWRPHLKVTRQVQAWIDVGAPREGDDARCSHGPEAMPTWIRAPDPGDELPPLYGFPVDPHSDHPRRIKIALHGRRDPVEDPDDPKQRRTNVDETDLEELRSSAVGFLRAVSTADTCPGKDDSPVSMETHSHQLCPPFVDAKTCLYTVSPDEHFLLGRPEGYRHVFGSAGLSGHGFKMVPALGKALADLALDEKTDMPIEFLSPSRFGA